MAGATFELDKKKVLDAVGKAVAVMANPAPMYSDMGEYLMRSHLLRFSAQQTPDGMPWTPLSPRYKRQKKKNKDKILILDGYLMNTLRYQTDPEGLLFGSNRPYAALMHFGGVVQRLARSQDVYFKRNRDGSVGNRFVKKEKSDFAQHVDIKEHTTTYPARPWLGTSAADDKELINITLKHLQRALEG